MFNLLQKLFPSKKNFPITTTDWKPANLKKLEKTQGKEITAYINNNLQNPIKGKLKKNKFFGLDGFSLFYWDSCNGRPQEWGANNIFPQDYVNRKIKKLYHEAKQNEDKKIFLDFYKKYISNIYENNKGEFLITNIKCICNYSQDSDIRKFMEESSIDIAKKSIN